MLEGDGGEGGEKESKLCVYLLTPCYHHTYHICIPQERIVHGPPEADSDREKDFQHNLQSMKDIVRSIVHARREGKGSEDLPFIDALLQSGVPEKQVGKVLMSLLKNVLFPCACSSIVTVVTIQPQLDPRLHIPPVHFQPLSTLNCFSEVPLQILH